MVDEQKILESFMEENNTKLRQSSEGLETSLSRASYTEDIIKNNSTF